MRASSRFHLALWMLLLCGKLTLFTAGSVSTREECSNGDITLNCEPLEQANKIEELEWKVKDSHTNKKGTRVAYCDETLRCTLDKKSIEGYGINLSVSNGSLSIKRSSRNIANGTVEFWCRVQPLPLDRDHINSDKFHLSLECIWTHVGGNVNLTSQLMNILPWKRVLIVELFDSKSLMRFAYCDTNRCKCTLCEDLQPTPALSFGERLKETQGSILLTAIRKSDEGLQILIKTHLGNASFKETCPYILNVTIRLKPNRVPHTTPRTLTFTQALPTEDTHLHQEANGSAPKVWTESGAVVGKIEALTHCKSVYEYLGIPYAKPPVQQLRFAAPIPVTPWRGIKEVKEFGAACPQPEFPVPNVTSEIRTESEDCLYLNVFVPSTTDAKMAVMVWIHGGAFKHGSSTEYPGHVLAAFNDVIVVTFNYRLGVLGFLNIPGSNIKGNYGMLDQVLALKWVQKNIANFGGDPNRVTIFGENAGGMSVSLHLISPKSQGLFQRAIIQSGAASSPYLAAGKKPSADTVQKFALLANCSSPDRNNPGDLVGCLRSKDTEEIISFQKHLALNSTITSPVVDHNFLPKLPQKLFKRQKFNNSIDIISGFTSHKSSLSAVLGSGSITQSNVTREAFELAIRKTLEVAMGGNASRNAVESVKRNYTALNVTHNKTKTREMLFDFENDLMVVSPTIFEAKALAKARNRVYMYVLEHRPDISPSSHCAGEVHGRDIGFVFGAPFKCLSSLDDFCTPRYSDIEKGFSWYIMKMWTDFAKVGNPTPSDSNSPVKWSPFEKEKQSYLALDLMPRLKQKYTTKGVTFWNKFILKGNKHSNKS